MWERTRLRVCLSCVLALKGNTLNCELCQALAAMLAFKTYLATTYHRRPESRFLARTPVLILHRKLDDILIDS